MKMWWKGFGWRRIERLDCDRGKLRDGLRHLYAQLGEWRGQLLRSFLSSFHHFLSSPVETNR
jgi:hypothetical protein